MSIEFHQHAGVTFNDQALKITRDDIYPPPANDSLAVFAYPQLTVYPVIRAPRPLTAAEYLAEAKGWYQRGVCHSGSRALVHSIAHGLGSCVLVKDAVRLCTMADLIGYYQSQAVH